MLARLRALVNLHHHQPIPVVRLLASYASSRSYSTVVGTAAHEGYASLVRPVPSIKLNELHDNKGAKKPRLRVGRGPGSGKGKTCGRGHKGTGQREAGMHAGFEGGQFPMYRRVQKFGFKNLFRREYAPLNLNQLQHAIDTGRIDPSQPITLKTLKDSGIVRRFHDGVKLLANGAEWFTTPVHLELTAASKEAKAAVEKVGGSITTVYLSKLGLRTVLRNEPEDITINFAGPPRKIADRFDMKRYVPPPRRAAEQDAVAAEASQ